VHQFSRKKTETGIYLVALNVDFTGGNGEVEGALELLVLPHILCVHGVTGIVYRPNRPRGYTSKLHKKKVDK